MCRLQQHMHPISPPSRADQQRLSPFPASFAGRSPGPHSKRQRRWCPGESSTASWRPDCCIPIGRTSQECCRCLWVMTPLKITRLDSAILTHCILYFHQSYTMNSGDMKSEEPFAHLHDHHIIAALSRELTTGLMASEGANSCCSQVANCS
jgi:hypothetical protein